MNTGRKERRCVFAACCQAAADRELLTLTADSCWNVQSPFLLIPESDYSTSSIAQGSLYVSVSAVN